MPEDERTLPVRFTSQQIVFLEMLRKEGRFGDTLEEVVLSVFREYVRATLPNLRS